MSIWHILSRMTSESERDLRQRFRRAVSLLKGRDHPKDFLEDDGRPISGKVFVITTWSIGKGEEDFRAIMRRKHHKITETMRLNWIRDSNQALVRVLRLNSHRFSTGDIVAIVRGGGDTKSDQFAPFNNPAAVDAIFSLREQNKAIVVTGIGHASDLFAIEEAATFNQATPTDAAYLICQLLEP